MKKILFIGAGYSESFFMYKSQCLGYYVIAIDSKSDAVGFDYSNQHYVLDITDKEACLAIAHKHHVNGVFASTLSESVGTASYIADNLDLPGLNYPVAELMNNKIQLRHLFNATLMDNLTTFYVIDALQDLIPLSHTIKFPVLLKYQFSYQKFGHRITNFHALVDQVMNDSRQQTMEQILIEEFQEGTEYLIELFIYQKEAFILGILEKNVTAKSFDYSYSFPAKIAHNLKVNDMIQNIVISLEINYGPVSITMMMTESNNIYLLDISASISSDLISSHIIPKALRYDYKLNLIRATLDEEIEPPPYRHAQNVYTKVISTANDKPLEDEGISMIRKLYRVCIEQGPKHLYVIGAEDSLSFAQFNVTQALNKLLLVNENGCV